MSSTKDKLLDAAELLFGEHGLDNVSVRMITGAAKANLSALGFHFGTRENLIKEVLLRRVLPLAERRRENLRAVLARPTPATAPEILRAFLDPVLELSRSSDPGEQAFLRTLSRTLIDPSPQYREILDEELAGLVSGYLDALKAVLPALSREELSNRLNFALGALGHAFADPIRRSGGATKSLPESVDRLIPQLLAFLTAGFEAPPALSADGEAARSLKA